MQMVQGSNQSSQTAANTQFATAPQLYLSSLGTWSLDTTGLPLQLTSGVRLPSSTSSATQQATLTLRGAVPSPVPASAPLVFAAQPATVPWSARLLSGLVFPSRSLVVGGVTVTPPLGAILYGGQTSPTAVFNDVYVSTDGATTWTQVTPAQPFLPLDGQIKLRDALGRLYLLGGNYTSTVQWSDDGSNWYSSVAPWHVRSYMGAVADPFGNVVIFGGQGAIDDHTGASGTYLNDVWISSNQGTNWTLQTGAAQWDIRDRYTAQHSTLVAPVSLHDAQSLPMPFPSSLTPHSTHNTPRPTAHLILPSLSTDLTPLLLCTCVLPYACSLLGASFYSSQLQRTILLQSGGHDDTTLNFRPNEVWASSDLGVSWTLFPRAPYIGRNHAAMVLAPNGVLVVVAGKTDLVGFNILANATNSNLGVNDVWVSVTGGTAWSLCTNMASFPPRQDLAATFDSAGYLYVANGINGVNATLDLADVWKSSISFTNIQQLQSACGVQVPACGIGLRCWPQAGRPYSCPCDFTLAGEEAPLTSTLALTPIYSPFSAGTVAVVQPVCTAPALPATSSASPFLILSWSFCMQTGAVAGSTSGPYSTVYDGQLTTQGNLTYSPVTGQLGYLITAVTGTRTSFSPAGVLSVSAIIGLGSLPLTAANPTGQAPDPYLYPSAAVVKTGVSTANISSNGLLFLLDTQAILPNGVQALSTAETGQPQAQQWLRQVTGPSGPIVVEAYQSVLLSSTAARPAAVYPTYGTLSIVSISAPDYVMEAVSLPSCPLNFTVFQQSSSSATMSYSMCATAVSSASSAASPWSLAESATVTVSAFPTFSATSQQYSFPILAVQSGSYMQMVQGSNQSSQTAANTQFATAPQLYLSSLGTWSLDTTGLPLALSQAVRLPSSSSSATATAVLVLQGAVASPAVSAAASPLTFASPLTAQAAVPWSPRLISGLHFLLRPVTFTSVAGASVTATPPLALIVYGGQANTSLLYNDVYVSSDAGLTFSQVAAVSLTQPFTPLDGAIKIRDSAGRLYLLGGSYTSTVQYSDNGGLAWATAQAQPGTDAHTRARWPTPSSACSCSADRAPSTTTRERRAPTSTTCGCRPHRE